MSITVRLWTDEELAKVKAAAKGEPTREMRELATIFLNVNTFSERELACYPIELCHTYLAIWYGEDEETRFKAVDDEMAWWFLGQEYILPPNELWEVITTFREVEPNGKV